MLTYPRTNLVRPDVRFLGPVGLPLVPTRRRSRPRWRPRPGWRRPARRRLPGLRAAGEFVIGDPTGLWTQDEAGIWRLAKDGECPRCCQKICPECVKSPAVVTFSGVVACWTGCAGPTGHAWHNGASLDGTYTLTYNATLSTSFSYRCYYEYNGPGPVALALFEGEGCTGETCESDGVQYETQVSIALFQHANTRRWGVSAGMVAEGLFDSGDFLPPGCADGFDAACNHYCWTKTVSNTIDCGGFNVDSYCNEGFFDDINHGGTATISVGGG